MNITTVSTTAINYISISGFCFSSSGNEHLFDIFIKRELGEANHLTLPPNEADALVSLCREMTEKSAMRMKNIIIF